MTASNRAQVRHCKMLVLMLLRRTTTKHVSWPRLASALTPHSFGELALVLTEIRAKRFASEHAISTAMSAKPRLPQCAISKSLRRNSLCQRGGPCRHWCSPSVCFTTAAAIALADSGRPCRMAHRSLGHDHGNHQWPVFRMPAIPRRPSPLLSEIGGTDPEEAIAAAPAAPADEMPPLPGCQQRTC
jgi:hypothetical protein